MRGDQLARQWRILMYLANSMMGRRLSQIAEEAECSERNVRRDLAALQAAGFAIYSEKVGQSTVWKVAESVRQHAPLPLTPTELFAIMLAETELRGSSDFISESFSAVTEKILKSRPPQFREQMELLKERFYAAPTAPGESKTKGTAHAQYFMDAISNNRKVSVSYRNASGTSTKGRVLAPLHIWTVNGTRYLVAYCYKRKSMRTFNLKRFQNVAILNERFQNDWEFDMQKHAEETFGVFHARPERIVLWLDPVLQSYISDHPLHSSQRVDKQEGGILVRLRVGINESLISRILGFGSLARVLAPDQLAIVVMEKHRAAYESYSTPVPTSAPSLPLVFD